MDLAFRGRLPELDIVDVTEPLFNNDYIYCITRCEFLPSTVDRLDDYLRMRGWRSASSGTICPLMTFVSTEYLSLADID